MRILAGENGAWVYRNKQRVFVSPGERIPELEEKGNPHALARSEKAGEIVIKWDEDDKLKQAVKKPPKQQVEAPKAPASEPESTLRTVIISTARGATEHLCTNAQRALCGKKIANVVDPAEAEDVKQCGRCAKAAEREADAA